MKENRLLLPLYSKIHRHCFDQPIFTKKNSIQTSIENGTLLNIPSRFYLLVFLTCTVCEAKMPSSPSIRPGSTSAVKLFEGEVCPLVWGGFLDRYENAVRAVGVAKKKLKELCAWDEWWRNKLPLIIAERKHLTKDELVQVSCL